MYKPLQVTGGSRNKSRETKSLVVLSLLTCLFPSSNALAVDSAVLKLSIEGSVPKRCSFVKQGSPVMSLKTTGTTGTFTVDCNTPFEYTMQSEHGGLAHSLSPDQVKDKTFKRKIPYEVNVRIPLDQSTKPEINDSCHSNDINSSGRCKLSDSGSGIAIHKEGSIKLTPLMEPNSLYLAGGYADTLTLEVKSSH